MTLIQVRACEECSHWKDTSLPYYDISININKWHSGGLVGNKQIERIEFCSIECLNKFVEKLSKMVE